MNRLQKRHLFGWALLALASVAPPVVVVRADTAPNAQRLLQARYDQFDRAYMKKDFTAIASFFAPDCTLTLAGEKRSMKAPRVVSGMKALSGSLTVSHAKTRIVSIAPAGDGYIVDAAWTGYSVYAPARKAKDDPARRSWTKQRYRDTWKKTNRGWQITLRIIQEADPS